MGKDILICGDFMPGGVLYRQDRFADNSIVEFTKKHQFVVATLECALSDNDDYLASDTSEAVPKVVVRKQDLERLYALNVNVVSLANNHVFDLGIESYDRLTEELTAHNIKFFGAGHNVEEASRPVVFVKNNKKIAIYGCCMEGAPPTRLEVATEDRPGIWKVSIQDLMTVIRSARSMYDYIFVMPHGGEEYKTLPMRNCIEMSRRMVDAGADGVFWSHTHRVQPRCLYKGCPIYCGLGSLLFPDVYVYPPRSVFYPSEKFNYTQLERCKNFPKRVDKPTLARWEKASRKGVGVTISISENSSDSSSFFEIDQNNNLKKTIGLRSLLVGFGFWLLSLLLFMPRRLYGKFRKMVY